MARNNKRSSYEQLYASHEIRMWLTQIILPAGAILAFCPELREWIGDQTKVGIKKIKNGAKNLSSKIHRK